MNDSRFELFIVSWQQQQIIEDESYTRIVFTDGYSGLRRLHVFQAEIPSTRQQFILDEAESRKVRQRSEWNHIRTLFCPCSSSDITKSYTVETADPPRRHRLRPLDKLNNRDLAVWSPHSNIDSLLTVTKGSAEYFIDYADSPDRYVLSPDAMGATPGWRRLYRFIAFPATQYYIMATEYNGNTSCFIASGQSIAVDPGWTLIGSFYGFDKQVPGSNRYTIFTRQDPFPRMLMSSEDVLQPEGWSVSEIFYAFDIPLPRTCPYLVKHAVPSVLKQHDHFVSRHKLTTLEYEREWDFRLRFFVYPASIEDCTFTFADEVYY